MIVTQCKEQNYFKDHFWNQSRATVTWDRRRKSENVTEIVLTKLSLQHKNYVMQTDIIAKKSSHSNPRSPGNLNSKSR